MMYAPALKTVALFGSYYDKVSDPEHSISGSEVWALVGSYVTYAPMVEK